MVREVSFDSRSALILSSTEHSIDKELINNNALAVVEKINASGYQAYLVGGCVRDLMLGISPKDFDVATSATPEQVNQLFSNCRLIGRRFRLAHVNFRKQLIEVATFRGAASELRDEHLSDDGRILRDNVYGTLQEDAARRDFTVNALYYNVIDNTVIDFGDGVKDLGAGVIKLIGDPETRFREDPVRMLRAIRFAAKLKFEVDDLTNQAIHKLGPLLENISSSRLYDEIKKLLLSGHALITYELLSKTRLFDFLFAQSARSLAIADENSKSDLKLLQIAMKNTDSRVAQDKPVTPAFLFAVLLWPAVRRKSIQFQGRKSFSKRQAMEKAGSEVAMQQVKSTSIPRRFSQPMKEIWLMQLWFEQKSKHRITRLLSHQRFRAAYDFLVLRAEAQQADSVLAQYWTDIQEDEEYKSLINKDYKRKPNEPAAVSGRKRPRKRPRRFNKRS